MKLDGTNSRHLTYCLNVHPGETWDECVEAIQTYAVPVRDAVAPGLPFGLGLRISDMASRAVTAPRTRDAFRELLATTGLYAFTVNAFPYGTGEVTGNPVKSTIIKAAEEKGERRAESRVRIVVMGGSQGATTIDERVPAALGMKQLQNRITVLHQCGSGNEAKVRAV